ncbi:MAG: response regulator [Chlamydiota bacterium]|jgi:CheY-like chemotaxis protein
MGTRKKRILLADDSKYWRKKITKANQASSYVFSFADNGKDCLKKIKSFKPDLILLKLMLPMIHGIEILSKIKSSPETKNIGVIITTSKQMIQDYHAAMEAQVDYFLIRPFKVDAFFKLVEAFFKGKLKPQPFIKKNKPVTAKKDIYNPAIHEPDSYLKFWGTRGSITVAGTKYARYGGNTSCLEIRQGKDLIIIDAGTGIRQLGFDILKSDIRKIHLFLGHTHWDHILGFPFFEPLYKSNYEIHIWGPKGFGRVTEELFTDMLAYEFFPIRLDEVQAKIHFHEIADRKPVTINKNIKLDFHFTFHPGMTYCFKIYTKKHVIGYATDNEMLMGYLGHPNKIKVKDPKLEPHQSLIKFFKECSILIHEAQYTPLEYKDKIGWGHSSIPNASVLLKYTKVPEWIVTHHDPQHDDEFLINKQLLHRQILGDCKIPCHVTYAFDGLTVAI